MIRIAPIFFLGTLLAACELNVHELNAQNSTEVSGIIVVDNNVSGGGFQSDVTITDDGLTVYSSADVSGVFKSTDGGLRFESHNKGLKSPKVASLAITPDNDQILYAGTGDKGGSGGLFRSTDGGETWTLTDLGDNAQFAGNHSAAGDPVPTGHPRSNGDLIVVDAGTNSDSHTDDIVIAGTYRNGVQVFTGGGDTGVSSVTDEFGETDGFVRSVARNSALPDTAFAAIQFSDANKNGIYRIDYSDPSAPTSTLEYPTLRPEGLTVLSNGHVYGAIGNGGIVMFDGTDWSLKNTGLSTSTPVDPDHYQQWTAVTGYVIGTDDVVYAGTNSLGGNANGSNYSNIWRTVNGGNSWTPLVDATDNVSDQILGQSYDWWFRTDAFPQAGLGRTNSVVSSIDVARGSSSDSVSDDVIYVSGRGGIWKSENGGGLWEPAVFNMQATSNRGVAVNPNDPTQVVLANTDYVVLETGDRFKTNDISRDKPSGAESRGYDVIFDATSDELILGVGDRDTNSPGGGEVYVKSAGDVGAPSGSGWTNTNLMGATDSNNGRVRAVTYGYHDGNSATTQTILAAVEGEGVYRYHDGTWSESNGVEIVSTDRSNFVWPDNGNSGVVYLLDLSIGLYRSNDGGQNWTDIWPDMSFRNNDFYNTGYITADDNDPTTLYVSIQGDPDSPIGSSFKVYRMTGADSSVFDPPADSDTPRITDLTKHSGNSVIRRPGPIVFGSDGNLWLTQQQDSPNSVDAALFVMENPATAASFKDVTTPAYRRSAISPSGIDVSGGYVYVSNSGLGVLKSVVLSPPTLAIAEVNDGDSQRSAVDSIAFSFAVDDVVLAPGAVSVVQRSTATAATFEPVEVDVTSQSIEGKTIVSVAFDSHVRNSENALVDGNYQLTVAADGVTRFGVPMSQDFVFGDQQSDGFFSFYGDTDGNRNVNIFDLLSFRQVYLLVSDDPAFESSLDYDASGSVNVFDLLQFRKQYLNTLPFTFGAIRDHSQGRRTKGSR